MLAMGCGESAAHATAGGTPDADVVAACAQCAEGVCDPASGACVDCLRAEHCAADRPFCEENTCVQCPSGDETCGEAPSDPDPEPADAGPEDADAGAPSGPTTFEIRLASYNVRTSNLYNGAWGDTHVGWDEKDAERMRRVADTIASQKLTVVATQEMRKPERDAVLARLKTHHGQDWGFTTQKRGADDTVVLFRKAVWSKVREVHFVIPMQPGLDDRNQIGVLLEHAPTGRRVWVYSVHFAAGDSTASLSARAEAARRTVQSIRDEAVAKGHPFVLAGDFNATSGENVGDVLRKAEIMKYTRNVADHVVNDGCKTFNGRAGSEGLQACPGGVAPHIDQIWAVRAGMQVLKHQVVATQQTSRSSDHNPVITVLKL